MKINKLSDYLKRSLRDADRNVEEEFKDFLTDLEGQLRSNSPVDHGDFKGAWKSSGVIGSSGNLTARVSNNSVYAGAIEFGSAPGSRPWPSPGPKTTNSGGRIYSSQAVGGVINKTLDEKTIMMFASKLANSIARAFR